MRLGDIVKIKQCHPMPEVVGENGEIVYLQTQEFEKYTVYPVWVKMTSGERRDKIYGFQYDEVEVLPEALPEKPREMTVLEQVQEILRGVTTAEDITEIERISKSLGKEEGAMRVGDIVKIKRCGGIPELVGKNGEIVYLQFQEFEKYTVYPVWVKMASTERKGKIYGFQYDDIEVLPKVSEIQRASTIRRGSAETTKSRVVEQMEGILRSVTTIEDIVEIERVINEVKGKVLTEPVLGFWEDKTPCWEMFRCPDEMKNECPAFKYRTLPCWQIEGTYSKLHDYGERGDGIEICENCRVYKRWGHGEPIEIKLRGQGFNPAGKVVK